MSLFIVFPEDVVDCSETGDAILLSVEHRVKSQSLAAESGTNPAVDFSPRLLVSF